MSATSAADEKEAVESAAIAELDEGPETVGELDSDLASDEVHDVELDDELDAELEVDEEEDESSACTPYLAR